MILSGQSSSYTLQSLHILPRTALLSLETLAPSLLNLGLFWISWQSLNTGLLLDEHGTALDQELVKESMWVCVFLCEALVHC